MLIFKNLAFFCAGIGTLTVAGSASAGDLNFTVRNVNGNVSIQRLWTAAAATNQPWTETYLDSPIINARSFTFDKSVTTCLFDIKVQFSDGVVETFTDVNACRGDSVRAD